MEVNMKRSFLLALAMLFALPFCSARAQTTNNADREAVRQTALDYVEGIYNVDPSRIERSVHPKLAKLGFYRPPADDAYRPGASMTFERLIEIAKTYNKEGKLSKDAPKEITVFDVLDQTATAKLVAEWGIDYMHLAKFDGKWMIVNIIWQSHPKRSVAQQPQSSSANADNPAVRRARELAQIINAGKLTEARKYIQENYAPGFLNIPVENHLNFIARVHDQTRGVEFQRVQEEKPGEATVVLKNRLTGGSEGLFVRVEPESPHRISGLGLRRVKPPAGANPTAKLTGEQMGRELDAFLTRLTGADVFSGAALLARDGKVIYQKAFGMANKDFNAPNRIDTKFNLGSMNKMFTSVAIAQLVERGKLSFDEPLARFLPEFPSKEAAEKIKIKHLLCHTAGLGSYFNSKFMESSRARFRTVNDFMELAKDEKLAFEPGTSWRYSNTGMLVLGAVIEKASGQSYYDYIRENIYKPAGMINSDCYDLDKVNPNLAVGYEKDYTDNGIRFRNNIFSHVIRGGPAGGGYSTVEDLMRFDVALRSNKLVGPEYVKLLLSAKPELQSPGYGYGFSIDQENQIVGHSGGFEGISSNLDMFLASGYTVVVLSNYGGASFPVMQKMRELALAAQETRAASR
jgi:CubicO group peptidase (beta-lactamase class C family)